MRLGQMLLEAKLIDKEKLGKALQFQKEIGGDLGEIIIKLGFVKERDLNAVLAKQQHVGTISRTEVKPHIPTMKMLRQSFVEKHLCLPIKNQDGAITCAVANAMDMEAIEEIQFITGCRVETVLVPKAELQTVINHYYYPRGRQEAKDPVELKEQSDVNIQTSSNSGRLKKVKISGAELRAALVPLLIEKGIINEEELVRKALAIQEQQQRSKSEA